MLGKLTGVAVRVPLLNASLTDCVFEVKRPTTVEEVNTAFKRAAEGGLEGFLGTKSARSYLSISKTIRDLPLLMLPRPWLSMERA